MSIRRLLEQATLVLALLLLAAGLYGILQEPRPDWTRNLVVPAIVLIVARRLLRRGWF